MNDFVKKFEKVIIVILTILMGVVVSVATLELGWIILKNIITPPYVFIDIHNLLDIFAAFLVVLIGIELLETIKVYISNNVVRVEVVMLVGIIAVARKIIILNFKTMTAMNIFSVAAILIVLTFAYYLIKKIKFQESEKKDKNKSI